MSNLLTKGLDRCLDMGRGACEWLVTPENRTKVVVGTACAVVGVAIYCLIPGGAEQMTIVIDETDPIDLTPTAPPRVFTPGPPNALDILCRDISSYGETALQNLKKLCGGVIPGPGWCHQPMGTQFVDLRQCEEVQAMLDTVRGG